MTTFILATIGGLLGIVRLAEYLQTNAKAHSDVETLRSMLAKVEARVTALEAELERLKTEKAEADKERREVLYQNSALIRLLTGEDEQEDEHGNA